MLFALGFFALPDRTEPSYRLRALFDDDDPADYSKMMTWIRKVKKTRDVVPAPWKVLQDALDERLSRRIGSRDLLKREEGRVAQVA